MLPLLQPIPITCRDCGDEFSFTVPEQRFFAGRGLNAPKRCRPCLALAKAKREGDSQSARY